MALSSFTVVKNALQFHWVKCNRRPRHPELTFTPPKSISAPI